jgi:hypothetical protein
MRPLRPCIYAVDLFARGTDWGAKFLTQDVRFVVAVVAACGRLDCFVVTVVGDVVGDLAAGAWGHADF